MASLFDDIPAPAKQKPKPRDPPAPEPPADPTVEAHRMLDRLAGLSDELRMDLKDVPAAHRASVKKRAVVVLKGLLRDLEGQ